MGYEHVEVDWGDRYATVWMNRPDRRNALSQEHMDELIAAFEEVAASSVRGIVLAGRGSVFSSGHDFADMQGRDLQSMRDLLQTCTRLMETMQSAPQPVLARVHGVATAAGCQLVASADLAVAARSAAFAAPGGKAGWFCHTPMVAIARNVPRKMAFEMALTGDLIDAATAQSWGLVNRVVDDEDLDAACRDLLDRATRGSASSKALGKAGLYAQIDLDQPKAYAYAIELMAASSQTEAGRENVAAFLDKREPDFD